MFPGSARDSGVIFLITSVTRSASPGLAFQVAATTNAMSVVLSVGGADGVAQDADRAGLHLDDVPGLDPAVELQARAAGGGTGAEHVAGEQGLVLRGVGDQVAEGVVHGGDPVPAPPLAVDPD